jgi:hypothetical protein
LWFLISQAVFVLLLWAIGTYDKYPELAVPLFFIYTAAIAPLLQGTDFERKWKQLEKRRMKAVKADNLEEQVRIEEEREKLELYNIPLTLGHLNTFRVELDKRFVDLGNRLRSIEQKLRDSTDG